MEKTEITADGLIPKHQQLRRLIVGLAVPGQPIPSERELMARYGLARGTVRRAIDDLVAQGVLQRSLGRGTFAVRPRLESQLHLASFTDDMRRRGLTPSSRVISIELDHPTEEVAHTLKLDPDERCWRLQRIRLADGEPIAVDDGWYPEKLFPDLDRHDLYTFSLYEVFGQHYGVWIDEAEQTLWGAAADHHYARLLAAPLNTPLLVFQRCSSANGQPVERVVSHYRGDRYQVQMHLHRSIEIPT